MALSVYRLVFEMDSRGNLVRFLTGVRGNSLIQIVQNGSGTHPSSYSMITGGILPLQQNCRRVILTTYLDN